MKKLLAVLFVAAVMVAGLFAQDLEVPKGSFVDEQWNAEWVIGIDSIELKNVKTGELIASFPKDKMENENVTVTGEGAVWSFYCSETYRKYYFIKPYSMLTSKNILLQIDPDWTHEDYKVELKFKE